jgi:hypothetical protein
MSTRWSEYARVREYSTPPWLIDELVPQLLRLPTLAWEPFCGSGQMVEALAKYMDVVGTDIITGTDFLKCDVAPAGCDAIVSNPEFRIARQAIEHAISLMEPRRGFVAMLLPTGFGHAKTRQHLFGNCPQFCKKIELTRRIVFFDRPGAAPSEWHAWFCGRTKTRQRQPWPMLQPAKASERVRKYGGPHETLRTSRPRRCRTAFGPQPGWRSPGVVFVAVPIACRVSRRWSGRAATAQRH